MLFGRREEGERRERGGGSLITMDEVTSRKRVGAMKYAIKYEEGFDERLREQKTIEGRHFYCSIDPRSTHVCLIRFHPFCVCVGDHNHPQR